MWKLSLAVGFAAGYVLGSRAGRQRYEQIAKVTREIARNPTVQNATDRARQQAGAVAGKAADAVAGRVGDRLPNAVTDRVPYFNRTRAEDDGWGTFRP
ncbi:hypothetical protein DR950_18365 [Kitasatospora xanthocidica]|uniref:YtxH domain-containing protein n=2 Tax=Kitasatosporales TaxID=85011 RepID=A0A372ZVH2_9ACTN|nr:MULTISPECIES: hypothetical protein [Streptomycetaceae]OKI11085.1 hypothetical protein AMK13_01035 [Streptomyces sp. CB02056]RGD59494.1 hypothetical protein DR950_18365 [Kitasatospora xanthocidica]